MNCVRTSNLRSSWSQNVLRRLSVRGWSHAYVNTTASARFNSSASFPLYSKLHPQINEAINCEAPKNKIKTQKRNWDDICARSVPAGGVDDDDGDIIGIVIGWETSGREDGRDFRAERLGRGRGDETGFAGAAVADDGDSDARAGAGGWTATWHRFDTSLWIDFGD